MSTHQEKQIAALSMAQHFLLDALFEIRVCEVELGVDPDAIIVPSLENWFIETKELIKLADENLKKTSAFIRNEP